MMDFGGKGGKLSPACGNVRTSFERRSLNSEYLETLVGRAANASPDSEQIPLHNFHRPALRGG